MNDTKKPQKTKKKTYEFYSMLTNIAVASSKYSTVKCIMISFCGHIVMGINGNFD
jgi:hypothetical protein